ncbi:hypothetical protein [Cryobacterium sp. CG_9.6]|uniref:hypothetical protein n=1 Tax=Cryobacterium sp. CG_9.6 TaxID=2760710 RepID=UPI0024757E12|nr:hypothetical protein [Cryobacterium sp. CG_9.6]MDH6237555.1 hypothetical protein [Cryobacterium sp. CG_9.6]
MTRDELQEAIRQATRVTQQREVLIIGSQAILGSFDEAQLPERATLSEEVNIALITNDEDYALATLIDPASLVRICKKLPVGEARRNITIKRAQAFSPKRGEADFRFR